MHWGWGQHPEHHPAVGDVLFGGGGCLGVVLWGVVKGWISGRDSLQAQTELGAEWTLMRGGSRTCPEMGVFGDVLRAKDRGRFSGLYTSRRG